MDIEKCLHNVQNVSVRADGLKKYWLYVLQHKLQTSIVRAKKKNK